jgi:hypothetical protein
MLEMVAHLVKDNPLLIIIVALVVIIQVHSYTQPLPFTDNNSFEQSIYITVAMIMDKTCMLL